MTTTRACGSGAVLISAAGAGAPPPAQESSKSSDPNVVDADFEVVDDDKK